MILLTVATSGDPCSLALSDGRGLLVERVFRHRMHLSERLIDDVRELLVDAGMALREVDAFAVDVGPGSFTGVRIGVMAIKTWADLLAKPVVGISALEAAAYPFVGVHAEVVVPMVRARPGAVYATAHDGATGEEKIAPALLTGDDLGEWLVQWRGKKLTVCGDGWLPFERALAQSAVDARIRLALVRPRTLYASHFAELARARLSAGLSDNPLELVPLYIAPPPIGQRKGK